MFTKSFLLYVEVFDLPLVKGLSLYSFGRLKAFRFFRVKNIGYRIYIRETKQKGQAKF